jgi:hypothetical protein
LVFLAVVAGALFAVDAFHFRGQYHAEIWRESCTRATYSTANRNTGSNALCGTVTARPLIRIETGQLLMAQFSRP